MRNPLHRTQLPVYSPLSARALLRGLGSLFGANRDTAQAEATVLERLGGQAVVLTDGGTSALCLAIRAVQHTRPGPVSLPAYGCYDLATATRCAAVDALLYDVDPVTLGPDLASLERSFRAGATSVVVAHLFGIPVAMSEVRRLATEHEVLVIDDAAQGAGAFLGDRRLGSLASLGILSFGRGKGMTAGRGGALLANDGPGVQLLEELRMPRAPKGGGMRELAASVGQWAFARPSLYGLPSSVRFLRLGETVYRPPHPAGTLSRAAAGILAVTLPLADREAEIRRRHAERLRARAAGAPALTAVSPPAGSRPGYLRLPVLAPGARSSTALLAGRYLGVAPGYPLPLSRLPGFAPLNTDGSFPGAERLARELATLPTHSLLSDADLQRLERWMEAL